MIEPSVTTESRPLLSRLESRFEELGSLVVAFSGGVDSALVAAMAYRTLGARAIAVTAVAETLAHAELDHARGLAREIGIEHQRVTYSELENPEFARNPTHRCAVCQGMRMDQMLLFARREGFSHVCDGTNASDPGPDRPGLEAVRKRGVISPLLEAGIDKPTTRILAHSLGLSVWRRPANACLSSRIPHGQVVTLGKLRRVERAEGHLAELGFELARVRSDANHARVEVAVHEVPRLRSMWPTVETKLREFGFHLATIDPEGYTSGGANKRSMPG